MADEWIDKALADALKAADAPRRRLHYVPPWLAWSWIAVADILRRYEEEQAEMLTKRMQKEKPE